MLTVLGQSGCMPCKMTTRKLDSLGVPHRYADVSEEPALVAAAQAAGALATPLVFKGSEFLWSGYSLDGMKGLAA